MSSQPKKLLTSAEYLVLERKAEFKSEYFASEMFAMAGASQRHNLIVANIIRVLGKPTAGARLQCVPKRYACEDQQDQ